MPTAVSPAEINLPTDAPPRLRWTRELYDTLSGTGAFEGKRYELIEGELIDKMGANPPHEEFVMSVGEWLAEVFGMKFVRIQMSIDVDLDDNPTCQPEPDLCVTTGQRGAYRRARPKPQDVRLLVEVADSSVGFDRRTKARVYARAGIEDYWVVDIPGKQILVHRKPEAGLYREVMAYTGAEAVSPLAKPEAGLSWADLATE